MIDSRATPVFRLLEGFSTIWAARDSECPPGHTPASWEKASETSGNLNFCAFAAFLAFLAFLTFLALEPLASLGVLSSDDFAGHGRCFSSARACKYPTEGSGVQVHRASGATMCCICCEML